MAYIRGTIYGHKIVRRLHRGTHLETMLNLKERCSAEDFLQLGPEALEEEVCTKDILLYLFGYILDRSGLC